MLIKRIALILLLGSLFGCASIVEGTDQTLTFKVEPEAASCEVLQKGKQIGTLTEGGGQLNVPKSKDDVSVECSAPGYKKQIVNLESSASGWGIVGCFLIDLCITDYATGALNKYDDVVTIRLPRDPGQLVASAAPPVIAPSSYKASGTPPDIKDQWRTVHDRVRGYWGASMQSDFVLMPSHVPLSLVRSEDKWGLFRYTGNAGKPGEVWILLSETEKMS